VKHDILTDEKNLPSPFPFLGIGNICQHTFPTHMDNTCTKFLPHCCTELLRYRSQVASTKQGMSPALAGCALVTVHKVKDTSQNTHNQMYPWCFKAVTHNQARQGTDT